MIEYYILIDMFQRVTHLYVLILSNFNTVLDLPSIQNCRPECEQRKVCKCNYYFERIDGR